MVISFGGALNELKLVRQTVKAHATCIQPKPATRHLHKTNPSCCTKCDHHNEFTKRLHGSGSSGRLKKGLGNPSPSCGASIVWPGHTLAAIAAS